MLAAYAAELAGVADGASGPDLATYLHETVFADAPVAIAAPDPVDVAGFAAYLEQYDAGLDIERVAVHSIGHPDADPGTIEGSAA